MTIHPSKEIPQALVDRVVARRGRLHAFEHVEPGRAALVVIDMDRASCAREPLLTAAAIDNINALAACLRAAGGLAAYVTSRIAPTDDLVSRLGDERVAMYTSNGKAPELSAALDVGHHDVVTVKTGTSAFFPGRCDLHETLATHGIQSIFIAGLVTNICCESSGRDATELGYRVTMVSDALVGHSGGLHDASLATFYRYFGDVRTTDDAIRLIRRGALDRP